MWKLGIAKCLGVATLWVFLISLPHWGGPLFEANFAGAASAVAGPGDDPGDPFRLAADTSPQRAATPPKPASFATVHFKNDLGKTLIVQEARVVLDGKVLPVVASPHVGADYVVFTGRVFPGHHILKTSVVAEGNQRAGVFSYMKKYRYTAESEEVMTVPEDRAIVFTITAQRNKGMNVPIDKQIEIKATGEVVPNGGESLTN
jgi:hypothetical protein